MSETHLPPATDPWSESNGPIHEGHVAKNLDREAPDVIYASDPAEIVQPNPHAEVLQQANLRRLLATLALNRTLYRNDPVQNAENWQALDVHRLREASDMTRPIPRIPATEPRPQILQTAHTRPTPSRPPAGAPPSGPGRTKKYQGRHRSRGRWRLGAK